MNELLIYRLPICHMYCFPSQLPPLLALSSTGSPPLKRVNAVPSIILAFLSTQHERFEP